MTNGQKNVKRFFDSLLFCISNSEVGSKWDSESLKELFEEMKSLFLSTNDAEKIRWDIMWDNIISSEVYLNIPYKVEENDNDKVEEEDNTDEVSKDEISDEIYENEDYEIPIGIKENLLKIDRGIEGGRFIWVMQAKYCGPDIKSKEYSNPSMFSIKKKFENFIAEVDIDGEIKKMFCYQKNENSREQWILNAINSENFYEEINLIAGSAKEDFIAKDMYRKYCHKGNWEKRFGEMCKLLEMFSYTKKIEVFFAYKCYDEIAKILCELLPIVEFDGNVTKIKEYSQWRKEQLRIVEIINERRMELKFDSYERKACEMVSEQLKQIVKLNKYKEGDEYVKDLYLAYIDGGYDELVNRVRILNSIGRVRSWEGRKEEFFETLIHINLEE